jgi:two-component sensor histidine kinase
LANAQLIVAAGDMGMGQRKREDREADLIHEINRLRLLLRQAGLDAEHSSEQAAAIEQQHVRDVELERAETRAARADADELRHRLKNTLAVVQAIAHATLRSDVPVEDARAAFDLRLQALAHAHDILFESHWRSANVRAIIDGILAPYVRRGRSRIRARGPEFNLGAKPALAFGLALHELGTNAAKYGALSNNHGYVEISWTIHQGREFRLRWHERDGPPVSLPSRTGFGSRLIQRGLAAEFGGEVELEFKPDGLACTIRAPVGALTGSPSS